MARLDPHSFTDAEHPLTTEIELSLRFDFERRVISGEATLIFERPPQGEITLDTRGLTIFSAADASGRAERFELGPEERIRGRCLTVFTHSERVTISFETSPEANALQWLDPAQTAGGRLPYVFTQCQAIHARSIFPCQDTPRARVRYRARLDVPRELKAVMAARAVDRIQTAEGRVLERFEMPQPIPPYLFAFAVGDLASKEIGPRSAVYAEPAMLEAAAFEFAEVESMIQRAEALFGPYDWERFDILLMPPSFPYGGMENPRLTFITPTIIAKDRSLVSVVAHELAHSWTGNLVTNATMNDFWLNEGFTTYAERRILEALYGQKHVELHAATGFRGLQEELARFGASSPLTRLRCDLADQHPDDVYSLVPYEKGYLFLRRLEEAVGRPRFDRFLAAYIRRFRFQSITTDDFLEALEVDLPEAKQEVSISTWIDSPGIPEDAPRPRSALLERIATLGKEASRQEFPEANETARFSAAEWQIFLHSLEERLELKVCDAIESRYHFAESSNAEIRMAWLTIAARSGHAAAFPAIRESLLSIGRMKYLRPLYLALLSGGEETARLAQDCFERAQAGYHPVARGLIAGLLKTKDRVPVP